MFMSHRVVVSVRLGTGPVSCGRAAGEDKRVARQVARRDPRAPAPRNPPRNPVPALTLRANHTPNNAAAYYLLLRFICSYIGLMVSDRCERLLAARSSKTFGPAARQSRSMRRGRWAEGH